MSSDAFADFKLNNALKQALTESGYTAATPIQVAAIPKILEGKDLMATAPTGSGKTAAFALPILQALAGKSRHMERRQVRVLVLAPTRELAAQIHRGFETYGKHLKIKTAVIYGGISQGPQERDLSGGIDVLVATPGRLMDLVRQKLIALNTVETFVLDEADRMLDMGFIKDVRQIAAWLPKKRQTILFSATLPAEIQKLANSLLNNPVKISSGGKSGSAGTPQIDQSVLFVDRSNKRQMLLRLLRDQSKPIRKAVIFTRTKDGASRIAALLCDSGIRSDAIHADKSQVVRQKILEAFRGNGLKILVATDVLARGIDVDDITHVINFDLPGEAENYVHRIGRTARAGAKGEAISFCEAADKNKLAAIEKILGRPIRVATHPLKSR